MLFEHELTNENTYLANRSPNICCICTGTHSVEDSALSFFDVPLETKTMASPIVKKSNQNEYMIKQVFSVDTQMIHKE